MAVMDEDYDGEPANKKQRTAALDSDDDAPGEAAQALDSDDDSSSDSDSPLVAGEAAHAAPNEVVAVHDTESVVGQGDVGDAEAVTLPANAAEEDEDDAGGDDGASSSSSSSSSSSDSGESDSDEALAGGGPRRSRKGSDDEGKGEDARALRRAMSAGKSTFGRSLAVVTQKEEEPVEPIEICRRVTLQRDEIVKMLTNLPYEVAEGAIVRSYVRLAVQGRASDQCVIAEVVGLEPAAGYEVRRADGVRIKISHRIRCKRASSEKTCPISAISNADLQAPEFEQWTKLIEQSGVELQVYIDTMTRKIMDLERARKFRFDEKVVAEMLTRKGRREFNAQKESRMRFLVQCAASQMDISNFRDNDSRETSARHAQAVKALHSLEAKSTEQQRKWFEKRPNLYSVKMINQKNHDKQVKDDRHALDFTLQNEAAGETLSNPFERRACRPVTAWDLQLTDNGQSDKESEGDLGDEGKAGAAAPAAPAPSPASVLAAPARKLDKMVRAHSGARHILANFLGSTHGLGMGLLRGAAAA